MKGKERYSLSTSPSSAAIPSGSPAQRPTSQGANGTASPISFTHLVGDNDRQPTKNSQPPFPKLNANVPQNNVSVGDIRQQVSEVTRQMKRDDIVNLLSQALDYINHDKDNIDIQKTVERSEDASFLQKPLDESNHIVGYERHLSYQPTRLLTYSKIDMTERFDRDKFAPERIFGSCGSSGDKASPSPRCIMRRSTPSSGGKGVVAVERRRSQGKNISPGSHNNKRWSGGSADIGKPCGSSVMASSPLGTGHSGNNDTTPPSIGGGSPGNSSNSAFLTGSSFRLLHHESVPATTSVKKLQEDNYFLQRLLFITKKALADEKAKASKLEDKLESCTARIKELTKERKTLLSVLDHYNLVAFEHSSDSSDTFSDPAAVSAKPNFGTKIDSRSPISNSNSIINSSAGAPSVISGDGNNSEIEHRPVKVRGDKVTVESFGDLSAIAAVNRPHYADDSVIADRTSPSDIATLRQESRQSRQMSRIRYDIAPGGKIVVDVGSYYAKIGMVDSNPQPLKIKLFDTNGPRVVSGQRGKSSVHMHSLRGMNESPVYNVPSRPPIANGVVNNWEEMIAVYEYLFFDALQVNPADHSLLMADVPWNPPQSRERLVEVLFESFDVPAICVTAEPCLSLFATGRTTGAVVEIGDHVQYVQPIFEGTLLNHAMVRGNVSGKKLTDFLKKMLQLDKDETLGGDNTGLLMTDSARTSMCTDIKESMCYVAENFKHEINTWNSDSGTKSYPLPDGRSLSVGKSQFVAAEALFDPSLFYNSKDFHGLHQNIFESISKCPIDTKRDMYGAIVLSGGTTLLPNLQNRLRNEVAALSPSSVTVNVAADTNRDVYAYLGGLILAGIPEFDDACMTREDYEESGAAFINMM